MAREPGGSGNSGGRRGRRRRFPVAAGTVAGGEAAAEAEAAGRFPSWPSEAAAHRQYPFLGFGAASRLHEETERAPRAGIAAPERDWGGGMGRRAGKSRRRRAAIKAGDLSRGGGPVSAGSELERSCC